MGAPQVFSVSGLVPQHFTDSWLARGGAQLGRFDGKTGHFHARLDAAETPFTERALTYIETFMYATLNPPLEARTFIPTSVKATAGAETYLWRKITRTGMARLITGSALDLPRASMFTEEVRQPFYPIGVKIVYNYFELLAVGMALSNGQGVDLIGESLRAAMEAVEKKLDIVAAFGTAAPPAGFGIEQEADVGLTGLLNNPNTSVLTLPPGASGQTAWASKTPDEILLDLNAMVGGQVAATFKVHRPDTILVPILADEVQLQRRMSDVSGETIKSFFLRTRREGGHTIEILSWMYMAGSGAAGLDLMISYKRDPRMFEHVLAMDATPLPATTHGLETTQPVLAKTAGIVPRYPLSITSATGI